MLVITPEHLAALHTHAKACYPNEACALIVGRIEMGVKTVHEVVIVANAWAGDPEHSQRDRYLIAPRDIAHTDRAASKRGLDLIGVFHSHPDHPAQPSATDLAQAWPELSYIIAAVYAGCVTSTQSWVLQNEQFEPEALVGQICRNR